MTVTPRVEMLATGVITVALIVAVGAAQQAGIIGTDTAQLATGTIVGGGLGWGGKTAATSPSP